MTTKYVQWTAVLILALAIGMAFFIYWQKSAAFDSEVFSAVFLSNDQVYFGHIQTLNDTSLTLSNVYYLKTQAEAVETDQENEGKQSTAQISLIKLGDELHSPTDQMTINREHVLFYETMRSEGTIMNAIRENEQK